MSTHSSTNLQTGLTPGQLAQASVGTNMGVAVVERVSAGMSSPPVQPPDFADDDLALRFSVQHGNDLRYTAALGRWSIWTGQRWEPDLTLLVPDLVRQACREASSLCYDRRIAPRVTSAATVCGVERLARADRRHAATIDQWDRDPWLLNTPAGAVDLRTGVLRAAAREDYCTKITAVAPGGECPLWMGVLARITGGNLDYQQFLQRIAATP